MKIEKRIQSLHVFLYLILFKGKLNIAPKFYSCLKIVLCVEKTISLRKNYQYKCFKIVY